MDVTNLLVVGVDISSAAYSAEKAGYEVYAVDHYGDQDLRAVCNECLSIIKQKKGHSCGFFANDYNPEILLNLAKNIVEKHEVDGIVIGSGLEDNTNVLRELHDLTPIIGNPPATIEKVRDKHTFFKELERLNVPCPTSKVAVGLEAAKRIAKDIGYPIVCKPIVGFGGTAIRKAKDQKELEDAFKNISKNNKTILIQKYIRGKPTSVSLLSTNNAVTSLTVNEQLLGLEETGQTEPFGYCGNIVPLSESKSVIDKCKEVSEKVVRHFNLIGSNGVDITLSDGVPYVVELNPRFQGTLECVERVTQLNLMRCHVQSCLEEKLPKLMKESDEFWIRLILFSPERSVTPDFSVFKEVRDVPLEGAVIEKGEPLCSVILMASSRKTIMRKSFNFTKRILNMI